MQEKNKVSLLDWRFKFGIFLLVVAVLMVIIALILMPTAKFTDQFNSYHGNGLWAINHYGVHDLLFNWTGLDDQAVRSGDVSHPYVQVFVALLFLLFLAPILAVLGILLIVRWWIKTRI